MTYLKSRASQKERLACIVASIQEKKGEHIVVLDFQHIPNALYRYMVICQGSSDKHVRAIADFVTKQFKSFFQEIPYAIDDASDTWIVLDYLDIMVHIFDEETRHYYSLEELWGDTTLVDITHPDFQEQMEKFVDEIESPV